MDEWNIGDPDWWGDGFTYAENYGRDNDESSEDAEPQKKTLHDEAYELYLNGDNQGAFNLVYDSIRKNGFNGRRNDELYSRDMNLKGMILNKIAVNYENQKSMLAFDSFVIAIESFKESLEIRNSAVVKNNMALCLMDFAWYYINQNRFPDALLTIREAMPFFQEKDFDYASALNCNAIIFNRMNRLDEAVEYYKEALKYDPSNEVYRENMANLENGIDEKYLR